MRVETSYYDCKTMYRITRTMSEKELYKSITELGSKWFLSIQVKKVNQWSLTRKKRNKLQKVINGNRKELVVMSQNIPQGTNRDSVGVYLDTIINSYKPAVLFLNEIKADIVKEACPEGYLFIPGSLKDAKVLRLSAIVRKQLSYEVQEMKCELPTLKIKTNGWTFVGFYREWRKGGRTECTVKESLYCLNKNPTPPKDTEDIRLQCKRFESFVSEWKKIGVIRNKVVVLGDMNINHQHSENQILDFQINRLGQCLNILCCNIGFIVTG